MTFIALGKHIAFTESSGTDFLSPGIKLLGFPETCQTPKRTLKAVFWRKP